MVYVIDWVNKSLYLFLNIILGYWIFDICGIFLRVNVMVFLLVIDNFLIECGDVFNVIILDE